MFHSQGGKRPYHTIVPAIVTRGDDLFLSYGVMGAFMQVSYHLSVINSMRLSGCLQPQGHVQVLLNMLRGFNPQAALDAPRFCISPGAPTAGLRKAGRPGDINSEEYLEEGISPKTLKHLRGKFTSAQLSCLYLGVW